MQIVIDIPKKLYKHIKNDNVYYLEDGEDLYTIVKNGTLLPKGHGRLIDADKLLKEHPKIDIYTFPSTAIESAKTIIEANKTESKNGSVKRVNENKLYRECTNPND